MNAPTPAQKAAATRRIRQRAAEWRDLSRPAPSDDYAQSVADQLSEAARPTYSSPPMSREAVAWAQLQHLADAFAGLVRARHMQHRTGANVARWIGAVRAARRGTAALLAALPAYAGEGAPTHVMGIRSGDLVRDHDAGWVRVNGKTGVTLYLADGESIALTGSESTITALRPADAREYRRALDAAAQARGDDQRARFEAAMAAFDRDYAAAWEARDGAAMQRAADECRARFDSIDGYGTARQLITCRAHWVRHGCPPPRTPATPRHAKGFKRHVETEARLRARLDAVRALPGYVQGDRRAVVMVKDRNGRRVRVSGDALRRPGWNDSVDRVNPAGEVTARTGAIWFRDIAAIVPAREAAR